MCILFIYTNPQPPVGGYRLIVASNRDEAYKRPAKRAFLCPETNIIGGRDMEPGREGGMWLGVSIKPSMLKFATLLSVTGEQRSSNSLGRGPLAFNYLKSDDTPLDFVSHLRSDTYSPFNLVMMEVTKDKSMTYHHSNSPLATFTYEAKQILSFGNSTPGSPFTKVRNGKEKFQEIVEQKLDKNQLVEELLKLLKSEHLHLPDPELQRRAPHRLNVLSSIFVKGVEEGYGSRTHSLVLVDDDCNVEFIEHTLKEPIDFDNFEWDVGVIKSRF